MLYPLQSERRECSSSKESVEAFACLVFLVFFRSDFLSIFVFHPLCLCFLFVYEELSEVESVDRSARIVWLRGWTEASNNVEWSIGSTTKVGMQT